MKGKKTAVVSLSIVALLALACAPAAQPTPTAAPARPTATAAPSQPTVTPAPRQSTATVVAPQPKATLAPTAIPPVSAGRLPKGKIVIAASSLLDERLDPAYAAGGFGAMYYDSLYDKFFKRTGKGDAPELATAYKASEDGKRWELTLREGVKTNNGEPITAEDVVYSVERMIRLKSASGLKLGRDVEKVEAIGNYRVVFSLTRSVPLFMSEWGGLTGGSFFWVVPKDYIERVGDQEFAKKPVGSGPFQFVEHVVLDHLTLKAFPGYWGTVANVETVVIKVVPEQVTRLAMLKTGEADVADTMNGTVAREIEAHPNLKAIPLPGSGAAWISFREYDVKGSPYADKRVRLALALAIDKQAIVDRVLLGQAVVKKSIYHTGAVGWDASDTEPYPYDPGRAQQLLKEAGYGGGFETRLYTALSGSTPMAPQVGEAIMSYWQKLGIKATTTQMEMGTFWGKVRERSLGPLWLNTSGRYDEGSMLAQTFYYSQAMVHQATTPELDKLNAQQWTEVDQAKRTALLRQIQKIVLDEVFVIPVYDASSMWGVNRRVTPWSELATGTGAGYSLETVELKP